MLDANLKPWILEVNHSPSFSTDTPLDFKIKKNLITDTIKLLNLSWQNKQKYKKQKQLDFQKRAMKGKARPTIEEKEKLKLKKMKKRDNYERKNVGDYELIFPSEEETLEDYSKFINVAKSNWEDFNQGTFNNKSKRNDEKLDKEKKQIAPSKT